MKTALISRDQVSDLVNMDMVIDIVDQVYKTHGRNEAILPPKITLDLQSMGIEAWTNAMPGYVHGLSAAGIKWAGGYRNNPEKGLPYIVAMIILQDPETGLPLAVVEGGLITKLRTGASAGVCAKYLANSDSPVVAIIGAGQQGRASLEALHCLFRLKETRVYDVNMTAAREYTEEMTPAIAGKIMAVSRPEDAVKEADIVVTASNANEPIVANTWLKPGVVCISLGSYQEFSEECVLQADRVIVDNWEQCSHRGELAVLVSKGRFKRDMVYAEIGEIAAGLKQARGSPSEKIMAVPIGIGTHDIAIAKRIYTELEGRCSYYEFF
jgi:ornithine cyclodeaminase/alanine dehydrogenase-like protein (mu-crystallin family)